MKSANFFLYLSIILSVLAIYFDKFLFYLLWAVSILIGVSIMTVKDRNNKSFYIWLVLIIISLLLVYYIIVS